MAMFFDGNLYAGLSGLVLDEPSIDLGCGVILSKTYAHLMAPFTMAFAPARPNQPHTAPWKPASGGIAVDVTAELLIPESLGQDFESRVSVARKIVFLLRLWNNPAITLTVFSNNPFYSLPAVPDAVCKLVPFETQPRHFPLGIDGYQESLSSVQWVKAHWESTLKLTSSSTEFTLAMEAFDMGQQIPNTALTLISLWGALESIFAPSPSELRFRVSSLIACYLTSAGPARLKQQKVIALLYDKRSAAAHGKPKHASDDLFQTFLILRKVLIKIIEARKVPTRDDLDILLFGEATSGS
jgi:hypothetical protein